MARRVFKNGQVPPDMADMYIPQLVDDLIQQRAIAYEFEREGLTVSDDEVYTGLLSQYPQYFKDGVVQKDQFEQAVNAQGATLEDIVEQMRRQLLMRKIENIVFSSVIVTDKECEDFFKRDKEKAKIQYIAFSKAKFKDQVKPTYEQLFAFYANNKGLYITPEKRTFQVLIVDQAKVEASLVISDNDLKQAYSASMDNFRMPERVKARHILISTKDKSDAEKKQLLAKAQDLLKQLRKGADFAELAKKNTDDPGSKENGGDLGWAVHGQYVPEFEKAVWTLKPKEISDVITSQFGYHILQVMDKEPARVKPFDEVKADLLVQLKKDRLSDTIQNTADKVRAALTANPGHAVEIANQNGISIATVTNAAPGSPVPTLGVTPEIDNAIGVLQPNQVTPIVSLPANRLAIAVLNSRTPAAPSEFNQVESQVREAYSLQQATLIARDKADEAAKRLKAGEDIEKVAKSYGLEVNSPVAFGRSDSIEGLGQAVYVQDALVSPAGTILGPTLVQERSIVSKVTERLPADLAAFAAEKDTIRQTLRRQKVVERSSLFMDSVLARLKSEGKVKVHPDAIAKVSAAFRAR
jgi:peptidyl-prolyl cis-trans isomerase D